MPQRGPGGFSSRSRCREAAEGRVHRPEVRLRRRCCKLGSVLAELRQAAPEPLKSGFRAELRAGCVRVRRSPSLRRPFPGEFPCHCEANDLETPTNTSSLHACIDGLLEQQFVLRITMLQVRSTPAQTRPKLGNFWAEIRRARQDEPAQIHTMPAKLSRNLARLQPQSAQA